MDSLPWFSFPDARNAFGIPKSVVTAGDLSLLSVTLLPAFRESLPVASIQGPIRALPSGGRLFLLQDLRLARASRVIQETLFFATS